jgi:hypothetical protein
MYRHYQHHYYKAYSSIMEAPQTVRPVCEAKNKARKISDAPSNDSGVADLSTHPSFTPLELDFEDEGIVPEFPPFLPANPESYPFGAPLSIILE